MATGSFDEEWCVLERMLPRRWRELARETAAIQRARGPLASPEPLLRALLLYVGSGLSLRQAAVRAKVQELVDVSPVALHKRLRSSAGWLGELCRQMVASREGGGPCGALMAGHRIRAVDATTIQRPGATTSTWRVHYSIGLPDLRCDYFEVTDNRGAEKFQRFPVQPGDVILADRGYCHREGVAHVLASGGHAVVRLHRTGFALLEPCEDGEPKDEAFDVLARLRTLSGCEPGQWPVRFEASTGPDTRTGTRCWPARVCAVRKSQTAAAESREELRRRARKRRCRDPRPETLEFAEYVVVLVTLPESVLGCPEALELYRARWQIELSFKRLKSLLRLGHLPASGDESAPAWIQGKLLTALLIESLAEEARRFSPWGYELRTAQPVA